MGQDVDVDHAGQLFQLRSEHLRKVAGNVEEEALFRPGATGKKRVYQVRGEECCYEPLEVCSCTSNSTYCICVQYGMNVESGSKGFATPRDLAIFSVSSQAIHSLLPKVALMPMWGF